MEISFSIGPLLAGITTPESVDSLDPSAVIMPRPSMKTEIWSRQQYDGTSWTAYDVAPSDGTAQLSNSDPVLRDGVLQLAEALGTDNPASSRSALGKSGNGRPFPLARSPS